MPIGVNSFLWTANFTASHLPLIARAKALGLDGIEMGVFDFAGFPAEAVRQELAAQEMTGLICTALTGSQSLGTEDPAVRAATLAFLRGAIRGAAEAGISMVAGPFCSAVGLLPGRRRTAAEWQRAVEGLQELAPVCREHGVRLAVEPLNRFETYFLNTAADAKALIDAVGQPEIGVLYDTFHANIEEKNQAEAIRLLGSRIFHVHTCENDRGTPGTGPIDWIGVVGALREIDYRGWCVIETFGPAIKEIAAAACIWRDLADRPEDIPAVGAQNLRSLGLV